MQEFKINNKVKTNNKYLSWTEILQREYKPFNNGTVIDIYMIEFLTVAKVKIEDTIRDINVIFLELCWWNDDFVLSNKNY